jgi:hypothetical protein
VSWDLDGDRVLHRQHRVTIPLSHPLLPRSPCSFMKLRLDRVLKLDLGSMDIGVATTSTAPVPEFKDLDQQGWRAPYSPYAKGWWKVFMRE